MRIIFIHEDIVTNLNRFSWLTLLYIIVIFQFDASWNLVLWRCVYNMYLFEIFYAVMCFRETCYKKCY